MRILVLGAGGFIGVARVSGHSNCDLTNPKQCEFVLAGAERVYLCAGVTGGSGLIQNDPLSLVRQNLLIHANVFHAAREVGVKKVICLSSTTGYPDTDLPMSEDDYFSGELHPAYFNPGHTRRFIERLGAMYPELNVVFLRPSVAYGPGDDYDLETCHVIPALVRKVAERQNPITIWGDGSNWRDGVYIDDMVHALLLAADAPAGAYNIAGGEGMTVYEMLVTLTKHAGMYPWMVAHDLSKPSMLKKRVLVTDKARDVLKWEPTVRMQDGLCRTLEWYASR